MKATWQLYRHVVALLPRRAQHYLVAYAVGLGVLSILDAAALGLLAVVLGPVLTGSTLDLPLLGRIEGFGLLVAVAAVCLLIILKGVLAMTLLWRATRHFAEYELELGVRLFRSFMDSTWLERLRRNSADLIRLSDGSVAATISSFILPFSTLLGEVMSFVTISTVLAIAQPLVALVALLYLGLLGAVLYFYVARRSREAGRVALRSSVLTVRLVTEMFGALKELTLRSKTAEAGDVLSRARRRGTRARANAVFLSQVPRYALESGIVGGFVLVGAVGYLTGGLTEAGTAVALFSLAGFRMAPSVVRFQAIVSQTGVNAPHAQRIVDEIAAAGRREKDRSDRREVGLPDHPELLSFADVTFRYRDDMAPAVDRVTLDIPFGSSVAFVGSSGAGKSTMVDLILGLLEPQVGTISVDGIPLRDAERSWRSRVAYVPQEVALFDATIAQNVALTWSGDFDRARVEAALSQAQLFDVVRERSGGIDSPIGERGLALSGGQRQRLGIARALYSDPQVLVLDEATSSLDTATEAAVTEAIRSLRGRVTIITVAHRLATIKEASSIFFMSAGRVRASGPFDQLVRTQPEFARQAALAGLVEGGLEI